MSPDKKGCNRQPETLKDVRRQTLRQRIVQTVHLTTYLALALGTGSSAAVHADGLSGKEDVFLTKRIAARPASGWSSVIVRLDASPTAIHEARLRSLGAYVYRHLPLIH